MHAARRVANDGTLALGVMSGIGATLSGGDGGGGGGRVKGFGMMISCSLMANGLRPVKKSRMKSYSVF